MITLDVLTSIICDTDNEYHDGLERFIRCRQVDVDTVHIVVDHPDDVESSQTFEVKVREI